MKNNKAQDEAIRLANGPARILAGPGSGKTYTLVNHINYLINKQDVDPNKILVITFTKAAASEMQQRFQKLSEDYYSPVHFHTFHSLFYSFLKHSQSYSSFSVLTNQERIQIINHISNKLKSKFSNEMNLKVDELSSFIAYELNGGTEGREGNPLSDKGKEFVMKEYSSLVNKQEKLDFDDFANKVLEVFHSYPNFLKKMQSFYNYILVDEFQDINSVQYEVVKLLAKPHNNLFVVGDDDQAIYGFRGSDPSIMQQFFDDYPDCKTIILNSNYRSSSEILSFALNCINDNENRLKKELVSERGDISPVCVLPCKDKRVQNSVIISKINDHIKNSGEFRDIAIICRTNASLDYYSLILKKSGIPFYYRERRKSGIFDSVIGKDILAYFRIALNVAKRKDYLQILAKGGLDVIRSVFDSEDVDYESIVDKNRGDFVIHENLLSFDRKMKMLRRMEPAPAINYICKGLRYEYYMTGLKLKNPSNALNYERILDSIIALAEDFTGLYEFLNFAVEYEKFEKEQLEEEAPKDVICHENKVNLLTMHGSKGLEFKVVILPDINDGKMPHIRSGNKTLIEEERRLFYVAMTRAMNELDILYVGGEDDYTHLVSRFIKGKT